MTTTAPDVAGPDVPAPDGKAQITGLVFAFVLVDPDGVIAQVNPAAEELLGSATSRLVGQGFLSRIGIDDPRVSERFADSDAKLTARGLRIDGPAGERHVNLTLSPVPERSGWRVVTLSDIGQSDMGDAPPDAMLAAPAVLAHEIKNPLSAIRGAGQLIARKLPENDRYLTDLVTGEVDRIARLVDRMQKLGQRSTENPETLNLHEAVRGAIALVRSARDCDAVDIVEEFDPSLPAVWASRDGLRQVLINLITNACDACSETADGGIVTIRTRFASGLVMNALRPGRSVRLPIELTILDNGPGIEPSLQERVFEPFVTSKKGGQGLGLALVRKLVRDMDGRIVHQRNERSGTTAFRMHLPVPAKVAS